MLRSLLYVPGDKGDKMASLMKKTAVHVGSNEAKFLVPDLVLLDVEDGTGTNTKASARENILAKVKGGLFDSFRKVQKKSIGIRINDRQTPFYKEDVQLLREILNKEFRDKVDLVDYFCLPKIETAGCLEKFLRDVDARDKPIIGMIESPRGLVNMNQILGGPVGSSLEGLIFGSDDYCSEMGRIRSDSGREVAFARSLFVTTCKAHKKVAIDMVNVDFKDREAMERVCSESFSLGFDGKQCIHPNQIEIVNRNYFPSENQLEYAKLVHESCLKQLKKYPELSNITELEAFKDGDLMIDKPTIKQSLLILEQANIV